MEGADLLDIGTGTPEVSPRSESGQGIIMGAKTGNGMLLCMSYSGGLVVEHVAGDCSLAASRVNVPCLAITAILLSVGVMCHRGRR